MLFALAILGLLLGWIDSPPRDKEGDIPDEPVDSEVYLSEGDISLDIPEFYLRPELIPIKEPDDTPKIADRWVRSRYVRS